MLRFVLISLAIFGALNVVAISQLIRIHPRRKPLIILIAAICNVMWLFVPMLNARTDFSRAVRAIFGPPWFAWLCFVLVYSAVLLLIFVPFVARTLLSVRTGKSACATAFVQFARQPSRIFLWSMLIALVIGVYTALVPLDVERVPISIDNLPPQLNGARIAVIADLHIGLFTRPSRLRQVFSTVAGLSPDVVLLAGDLVDDDPYFVPKLLAATRVLPDSLPLIGVLGNHEMYGQPKEFIARLRGSRIRLLVNEGILVIPSRGTGHWADGAVMTRPLTRRFAAPSPRFAGRGISREILLPACGEKVAEGRMRGVIRSVSEEGGRLGGAKNEFVRVLLASRPLASARGDSGIGLWIAGISDYAAALPDLKPNLQAALSARPAGALPIVVAHQPRVFPEAIARSLPLTLCAHTHGGQFGFRKLHWSLAGLFLPYHIGLYRRGTSQLYVNTGTGYWLLPWRIGVTPEITLVELRPSPR